MKKIYVTPLNKVRDLSTQEGILLVASGMEDKYFDTETSLTDQGAGEDFGRNNNRNTSIWDQGW
jgi:hypothetical protein